MLIIKVILIWLKLGKNINFQNSIRSIPWCPGLSARLMPRKKIFRATAILLIYCNHCKCRGHFRS